MQEMHLKTLRLHSRSLRYPQLIILSYLVLGTCCSPLLCPMSTCILRFRSSLTIPPTKLKGCLNFIIYYRANYYLTKLPPSMCGKMTFKRHAQNPHGFMPSDFHILSPNHQKYAQKKSYYLPFVLEMLWPCQQPVSYSLVLQQHAQLLE